MITFSHRPVLDLFRTLEQRFLRCYPKLATVQSWDPWKQSVAKAWIDNQRLKRPTFLRRYK